MDRMSTIGTLSGVRSVPHCRILDALLLAMMIVGT